MLFDSYGRRPRRRQNPMTDVNIEDLKDSGIMKALAFGAILYLGAKTINRMVND